MKAGKISFDIVVTADNLVCGVFNQKEKIMSNKILPVVAGFIGGVAFLISCGGGSGGGSVGVQDASASDVVSQMYCHRDTSNGIPILINITATDFGGSSTLPAYPEFLRCLDTQGAASKLSIQSAYQQGWKVQMLNDMEAVFYK